MNNRLWDVESSWRVDSKPTTKRSGLHANPVIKRNYVPMLSHSRSYKDLVKAKKTGIISYRMVFLISVIAGLSCMILNFNYDPFDVLNVGKGRLMFVSILIGLAVTLYGLFIVKIFRKALARITEPKKTSELLSWLVETHIDVFQQQITTFVNLQQVSRKLMLNSDATKEVTDLKVVNRTEDSKLLDDEVLIAAVISDGSKLALTSVTLKLSEDCSELKILEYSLHGNK